MPSDLSHSPARVIQQLLIDLGLGTAPSADGVWPVYATQEPTRPDAAITVYDTTGETGRRDTPTGERAEYNGIQVRVRHPSHETGYAKALEVALAFDVSVSKQAVSVSDESGTGSSSYTVWSVRRTSDVLALGHESPTSNRSLFTINALVSLREDS